MARLGSNKEIEKMVRLARKAGWDVEMTKNNHIRFKPPTGGDMIIAGLTPNTSGVLQTRKRLRRAGLAV